MRSAPAAIIRALAFGQDCRGATRRNRDRPKFAMARAAAPIFSPSCGSTRTTTGAAAAAQRLVLSVPAPGMVVLMHRGADPVEMVRIPRECASRPKFRVPGPALLYLAVVERHTV